MQLLILEPASRDVHIACWSWGQYLPHALLDVKISSYIRIHPRSTIADAKLVGHYVNSILASEELQGTNYHEALFLDFEGNVAEGPGENIFLVKNGQLYTPQLGTILPGITRSTIIELARDNGLTVQECRITSADLMKADEAFFTGTAVEVALIRSVDGHLIGSGGAGPLASKLKAAYGEAVRGNDSRYGHFLTWT
ncbi:MAG: aminotransferase class IV [Oligoflexia bacterium]|nr:aminotransferase class IV [Oligoflexia bacterium]